MGVARRISPAPLASALTLALGLANASFTVSAAMPSSNAAFKTRIDSFQQTVSQLKQRRQQNQRLIWPASQRHKLKAHVGAAATHAVTSCVDDASSATTPGTLRYGILNAADGDTVDLSGLGCSTVTLTQGALPVTVDNLTLKGPADKTLAIDGSAQDRVLIHQGSGTLNVQNLTVRNGYFASSTQPAIGGCVLSYAGEVALDHATVSGCTVVANGTQKYSIGAGGGVAAYVLSMTSSTITGNKVLSPTGVAMGGGAFCEGYYYAPARAGKSPRLAATISGNGSPSKAASYVTNSTISNNTAEGVIAFGGGAASKYGLVLSGSTISGNTAHAAAAPGGTGSGSYAALGGGLITFYNMQLDTTTVTGNVAVCDATSNCYSAGGGLVGGEYGGQAFLGITNSTISSNTALVGGGVLSKYTLGIVQSTISGNSAAAGAGVTMATQSGAAPSYIYNSSVAKNSSQYVGGGIYIENTTPLTLSSSMVASNHSEYGGADIYGEGATRSSGPAGAASTISGSNNLVMDAANVTLPPDTLNVDPLLLPLANNGGPTQTHKLAANSPAINKGTNILGLAFDQRGTGFPRLVGAASDIGALETQDVAPNPTASGPAQPVPALSTWVLGLMAGLIGWLGLRRRLTPPG